LIRDEKAGVFLLMRPTKWRWSLDFLKFRSQKKWTNSKDQLLCESSRVQSSNRITIQVHIAIYEQLGYDSK
jgi:hypothetical protein